VELVILDNLATLCRVGKENESESWLPIQDWLLRLRRRGIAVIVIHHANKSGGQRGTSSREDVMDTVIALRPTKEHTGRDGTTLKSISKNLVELGLCPGAFHGHPCGRRRHLSLDDTRH